MPTTTQPPIHVLAAIIAAARVSRQAGRRLCNKAGLGGGSGDLTRVLKAIEEHPRRGEIEYLARGKDHAQ